MPGMRAGMASNNELVAFQHGANLAIDLGHSISDVEKKFEFYRKHMPSV